MNLDDFEAYLKETDLSDNTITSYKAAVKQFYQQYDVVTRRKLKEHRMWLIESYKPKTVNLRIRALNCYLESIEKPEWKLQFVKIQQKAFLENVISEADYEYFKTCLKESGEKEWYFTVRFMAATGVRVSELIQIKVEHVKIGYLDLYSKGGKLRRIYIPRALREEAFEWIEEREINSGFLFLNKHGRRITTRGISGQLKVLAERYQIDPSVVYPHSFRHRFAKSFLERFQDIALLADLMGHESIETTRIYLRRTSTEQQAIVDRIVDW
ncbi:MAG: tyrosine-type recombinase/integrase [Lachnospiraceae bacterium]|nr:tyrosine-type recombinase/integrase [Lachnospiraceae bacterium]